VRDLLVLVWRSGQALFWLRGERRWTREAGPEAAVSRHSGHPAERWNQGKSGLCFLEGYWKSDGLTSRAAKALHEALRGFRTATVGVTPTARRWAARLYRLGSGAF